ncbi:capsular exopolysaccharide synthesis family protein [Silvibacterium bohemicum]|uniref:non-specific protein-tyrosine kinase n=1 Tax=Silvibacterium bohemicum TaxID=1577686 RepID=A0A841JU67_9BACT|nr:AAA family ATPase [Silvibacterium bohemicum]MBB6144896.1 capsular exopolysaccharide synthesis family protein [Silvibacterium bohemicum]
MTTGVRILELADLLQTGRQEWTFTDLINVLRRRRGYVIGCVGTMLALATIYCIAATPRFQAIGEIEVQKEPPPVFGLENSVTGDTPTAAADSLDYSMTLETEAKILESPTLALQTIKDLKLENSHDYFPAQQSGFQLPGWIFFWRRPIEPLTIDLEDAPNRRYVALKIFASHLKITPETGTRLIEIRYSDPEPRLAAEIVNRLIQGLIDYGYQARVHATAQASKSLANELQDLRQQTAKLQSKANRLQREAGIYGDDAPHNIVLERLDALNQRLVAAESNRLLTDAIDRISQTGDPELISTLAGGSSAEGAPALNNSLATLQTLRSREASVRAEIAENDARYGPAHPRIAELHSELDGVQESIHEEIVRVGQRAHAGFEVAKAAEDSARDDFDKQQDLADQISSKAVGYQLARQEAEGNRGVYQGLLTKLKEAGVLEGLHSTNLTIVSPGRIPPTHRPKSPNLPLCYAAAVVGGLFFGCVGAVFSELSDHTVRSLDGLERLTGSQLLGVLPQLKQADRLRRRLPVSRKASRDKPLFLSEEGSNAGSRDALFLESLRALRTSLLLLRNGRRSQVVLITSSVSGEGKSKVAVNLAGMLAQLGAHVLLVDADLRRPSVCDELHIEGDVGLDAALIADNEPPIFAYAPLRNLSLLCGQRIAPMPAELLASKKMARLLSEWRNEYDFVLLDSPPVLAATDALVLTQMSDITLLIARHGFTPKQAIHRTFMTLREQIPESCLMRVVLNGVHFDSYDLRSYYGYEPMHHDPPPPRPPEERRMFS